MVLRYSDLKIFENILLDAIHDPTSVQCFHTGGWIIQLLRTLFIQTLHLNNKMIKLLRNPVKLLLT